MLKRNIKVTFRLNGKELERLKQLLEKSGLSQESYLRTLINGYIPKTLPPPDYHAMMQELHAIGNNLNQIAARANTTGHIDKSVFQYEANKLRREVQEIKVAVTSPERMKDDGNDGNMGRERPP